MAPLNLSTVGHGGTFGTPPKGVCPVCPAIGTPTRWDICPACPVCPAADVSALVDEISELTADKLCEVPQSSCSKRAPRGSPGISPGARRVSSDADTGADSTSAATRRLSYPQSGGCMLIASQYQCDGCDVPIRGPSAGPCPGARPSARPARRPIGAPDCDPHPSSWKAAGEGVPVRNWRSRPSSCLSPAPFPSPEYLCQADRNSHCPTIFQPCARTSGLSANPLSARVNRRCVAGVSWQ